MKSIYLRNFFATAMMVLICFIIVAAAFVGIGRSFILREYRQNMLNTANEVNHMVSAVYSNDSTSDLSVKIYLTSTGCSTGNLIMMTDSAGIVTLCSDISPNCSHVGIQLSENMISQLNQEKQIAGITNLDGLLEGKLYVAAIPLTDSDTNEINGYIIVSNEISDILDVWTQLQNIIAVISLVVIGIVMVTALQYWKKMAKPLDEIASASRRFARGDFSVRVNQVSETDDEMGVLIDSFNKMADALEIAEKRRSEFISNISHELRTPMTTIGGFADGILDGTIPPENQDKYLLAIRDETHRLSRLVRNMLDISRASNSASDLSNRSDFDIIELTMQTLLSFESRANVKNLDVDPQFPDECINVHADKDAITRVIYNLIDNAVKFSNPGSCITIRVYKDNGKACVAVRDQGEEIPPEDLPYIFDRFHKSDRSRSMDKDGVGLGLYLVKTIINEHDEDIAVRSKNGTTEFVFTLSLAE